MMDFERDVEITLDSIDAAKALAGLWEDRAEELTVEETVRKLRRRRRLCEQSDAEDAYSVPAGVAAQKFVPLKIDYEIPWELQKEIDLFLDNLNNDNGSAEDCYRTEILN